MELRQLRYFIAVADTLNFSRASESLFLSQSALSRQISDLEDELGLRLFSADRPKLQVDDTRRNRPRREFGKKLKNNFPIGKSSGIPSRSFFILNGSLPERKPVRETRMSADFFSFTFLCGVMQTDVRQRHFPRLSTGKSVLF